MPNYHDDDDEDRPRRRRRHDEEDDDDRPRRRREGDDYDDRPRKKSSSGLLIPGLVLGGLVVFGLVFVALLWGVQRVRVSAARIQESNNLKQISLANYSYADAHKGEFPPSQEGLSWRVHLLPYIEQQALYRQFDMAEPWDGPTNKRFATVGVKTYQSPDKSEPGETHYRVFVGPNTLYPQSRSPYTLRDVPDGTSVTFFAVQASEAVPWTQPKELQYTRGGPLPQLGVPHRDGFLVSFVDGSVRSVSSKASPEVIRAGIDPADGAGFLLSE
jgi:hypothetical protein